MSQGPSPAPLRRAAAVLRVLAAAVLLPLAATGCGQEILVLRVDAGETEEDGGQTTDDAGTADDAGTTDDAGAGAGLVISELAYQGTSSTSDEFVELYNASDAAVDLTGLTLEYDGSSSGVSWNAYHVFPTTSGPVLPRGGFYLIGGPGFPAGTADVIRSNGGLSMGADGSLRLVAGDTTVMDQVAWGGGDAPEGSNASTAEGDQSLERKAHQDATASSMAIGGADEHAGNGHDTGNNAADFVVRAVRQPQGTTAPPEP